MKGLRHIGQGIGQAEIQSRKIAGVRAQSEGQRAFRHRFELRQRLRGEHPEARAPDEWRGSFGHAARDLQGAWLFERVVIPLKIDGCGFVFIRLHPEILAHAVRIRER